MTIYDLALPGMDVRPSPVLAALERTPERVIEANRYGWWKLVRAYGESLPTRGQQIVIAHDRGDILEALAAVRLVRQLGSDMLRMARRHQK